MHINMDDSRIVSIAQLKDFLKVGKDIKFIAVDKKQKYAWINSVLVKFRYFRLKKQDKSFFYHHYSATALFARA